MAFLTDGALSTVGLRIQDGAITERVSVSPPTVSVATTAGAGDAFAAAVLAARRHGVTELRELVTIGNAAGATAVTTPEPFTPDGVASIARFLDGA